MKIRHATEADVEAWAAMRLALWPDDGAETHLREARRFFAEARRGPGAMPEAVLLAEAADGALTGFAAANSAPTPWPTMCRAPGRTTRSASRKWS